MARPAGRSSEDTRRSLLDAGAKLFARNGYAGTSIREIAEEANLQSAMIAYYFKNKRGLYRAVIDQMYARMNETFTKNLPYLFHLLDNLEQGATLFWTFARQNAYTMRIMIQDSLDQLPGQASESMKLRVAMNNKGATELADQLKIPADEARSLLLTLNYYFSRLICESDAVLRLALNLGEGDDLDKAAIAEITRFLRMLMAHVRVLQGA